VARSFNRLVHLQGRQLTEVMNEKHENVKYLPGIKLPKNLVASSDIEEVVRDANILVFCAPHQFMRGIVGNLKGKVRTLPWRGPPQMPQCHRCGEK
jgi:glycerol-3-phosphate dehydrogenase